MRADPSLRRRLGSRRSDVTVLSVRVDDRPGAPAGPPPETVWATLRRVAAEAVILQDEADALLRSFRWRPEPAEVARPCGRLKGRFVELQEELPASDDPDVRRIVTALREVLHHHVLLLKTSQGFLLAEARCERFSEQLDGLEGLGAPARRLEALREELLRR